MLLAVIVEFLIRFLILQHGPRVCHCLRELGTLACFFFKLIQKSLKSSGVECKFFISNWLRPLRLGQRFDTWWNSCDKLGPLQKRYNPL
jgi:hypothetical protein